MEKNSEPSRPVTVITATNAAILAAEPPVCIDLVGPSSPKPLDLTIAPTAVATDAGSTEIDENPPKRVCRSPIPDTDETEKDAVAHVVVDAELPSKENGTTRTSSNGIISTKSKDESVQICTNTTSENLIEIIDLTIDDDTDLTIGNSRIERFKRNVTSVSGKKFYNRTNKNETVDLTDEDDSNLMIKIPELKHPAPLPRAYQKVFPRGKPLLPAPRVKITPQNSRIKFSWTMKMTPEMPGIQLFEVFYYEELPSMEPKREPWKKMMEVPFNISTMKCDLYKLAESDTKSKFHLTVRAIDVLNRLGPFSVAKTINYGG